MNPVDDHRSLRPLVRNLQRHVDAFAEATGDREAAVAWVYTTVLVAWAEDHRLVDPWLRADAETRRKEFLALPGMTMSAWVARAVASLCAHPGTWSLLDPRHNPLRRSAPPDRVFCDLADWWAEAPSLAYEHDGPGPASITGWIPGDLLQAVSDERRKGNALAQTPWWVADLILDRTLIPAAGAHRGDPVLKMIDPACGTGHFLVRGIDYLWELYTTGGLAPRQAKGGTRVTGWTPVGPAEAIRRIIAGVDGCEIDPLTAAVARLRVVATIGDLMYRAGLIERLRLDAIPPFRPQIVVGDSLLAGKATAAEYARLHPRLAGIVNLGTSDSAGPVERVQLDLLGEVL